MTAETAREGGLCGEDGRDCEGRKVVWGGWLTLPGKVVWGGQPRRRGEGVLCGDDGRDCEGREGCVGMRAETAREEGCVGRMFGTAREGGLCG